MNFSEETKTYIYILYNSSILAWHEKLKSFLSKKIICLFYIVNIIGADVLATQGPRVSATVISTMFNRINAVPAC